MLTLNSQAAWDGSRGVVDSTIANISGAGEINTAIYANNATGNGTGINGLTPVSYRGMENLWGNVRQFTDGYNSVDTEYRVARSNGTTKFNDTLTTYEASTSKPLAGSSGYATQTLYENPLKQMFVASYNTGGSASTYLCDYFYDHTAGRINILLSSGAWIDTSNAGIGSLYSNFDASLSVTYVGARLEFRDSNVTASFNGTPSNGLLPLTVVFVDNSSGYPSSWYWEFGDGSTSTSQNPTHTYTSSGTYDVNLRVMDSTSMDWENKSSYIFIPSVNFTATPTDYSCPTNVYNKGVCEVNVEFADTTNGPANTYFNWSFGDNTWFNTSVASLRNPTHKYSMIGTYSPSFSVTNITTNASNTYTLTKVDYIHIGESPTGGSIGYSIYNDMPGMMLYISAMIILAIFVTVLMMWYRPKNW